MNEDDYGKPENLTPREHSRRFSQGVPRSQMSAHPTRLVLADIQDHIRFIGRTSTGNDGVVWCDGEVIEMKRRLVDSFG